MTPLTARSPIANRWCCGFFTRLAACVALSLSAASALCADSEPAAPPGPRLSGTMISPGIALAVVAFEDGERIVRVGDTVEGWGRVSAVEPGRVRFETADGENTVLIRGGEGPQALAASTPEAPPEPVDADIPEMPPVPVAHPKATPMTEDITAALTILSKRRYVSASDLEYFLLPLLDVPATASIEAVNHHPVDGYDDEGAAGLAALQAALADGTPIRLSIGGADDVDAVYLLPPQPEDPDAPGSE